MYPEAQQTDEVQDVCETDTFGNHLDVMFPADAEAVPWDPSGAYSRARLELWYLSHAAKPLDASQLTEVSFACPDLRASASIPQMRIAAGQSMQRRRGPRDVGRKQPPGPP